jgi:putative DNA primase/helicase
VTAERKHAQPFRFRSYAKLLFSANKIPPSRDRTHAFYRRWLIIPFTTVFDGVGSNPEPDKGLRGKLRGELSGILNRALRGLKRLALAEKFTEPQSILEAKEAYIRSNDNVRVFVDECVIADPLGTIVKQEFYRVYETWCDRYGERAIKQKPLKGILKEIFPKLDECRAGAHDPWSWLGMKWGPEAKNYMLPSLNVTQSIGTPPPKGTQ